MCVYMLESIIVESLRINVVSKLSPGATTTSLRVIQPPVKLPDSEQNLVASAFSNGTTSNSKKPSPNHLTSPLLPGGPTLSCALNDMQLPSDSEQPFSTPNAPPLTEGKLKCIWLITEYH